MSDVYLVNKMSVFVSICGLIFLIFCPAINECNGNPCHNGGTCISDCRTCACLEGYTGAHCETGPTEPPQPAGPVLYNSSCLVFAGPGDLSNPWGVDVDGDTGTLYVADYSNHRVCLFTISGTFINCHSQFIASQSDNSFSQPMGIALTTDGLLVVSDLHRVMIFRRTGSSLTLMQKWGGRGSSGSDPGQFNYPIGVHVSGRNVYVCDWFNNRIQILNIDNATDISVIDTANSGTPGSLIPRALSIDSNTGLFYVAAADRVLVYNVSSRQYVRSFTAADLDQITIDVYAIAMGSTGQLYVGDSRRHVIHILTPDGVYVQKLGTPGSCPSCITSPGGIAVKAISGEVIVTESETHYIQVYQSM